MVERVYGAVSVAGLLYILFMAGAADPVLAQMERRLPERGAPFASAPVSAFISEGEISSYRETGGLEAILRRGRIRFLMPQLCTDYLPRCTLPDAMEISLIQDYAESIGVEAVPVFSDAPGDLVPDLLDGKGDVIAVNFVADEQMRQQIDVSIPLMDVRDQVVVGERLSGVESFSDLDGRSVVLHANTPAYRMMQEVRRGHPGIALKSVSDDIDLLVLLAQVASGLYDATIVDSATLQEYLSFAGGVRPAFPFKGDRRIVWGLRPDCDFLKESIDRFLGGSRLVQGVPEISLGDLPEIKKRGTLRVLTPNSAATYFIWHGQLMGFEYELMRRFAEQHHLQLKVVVPPTDADLFRWLRQAKADLIAAGLTDTEPQQRRYDLASSNPYHMTQDVLVSRCADHAFTHYSDLAGRTIWCREGSGAWRLLKQRQKKGLSIRMIPFFAESDMEEIIGAVGDGLMDLAVVDRHALEIEMSWRSDLKADLVVRDGIPKVWLVRSENTQLLSALNAFIASEYRSTFYNVVHDRYFGDPENVREKVRYRAKRLGELSPYDEIVKRYARIYGFDWRLIVAMMYQESRFDPGARSFGGALGLMQMLPRTARAMGFDDVVDPENGIHAGIKYLANLRRYFSDALTVTEQINFLLAAYNAGQGHVRDARQLAGRLDKNPDRWFGHVEEALLLLSKPEYARRSRFGYVRGRETVQFVRKVRKQYEGYVAVAAEAR